MYLKLTRRRTIFLTHFLRIVLLHAHQMASPKISSIGQALID